MTATTDRAVGYQDLVRRLEEATAIAHELNYRLDSDVRRSGLDDAQAVDVGILLRDLEQLCDDLRKECRVRKEQLGGLLGRRTVERVLSDDTADATVRGTLGSATAEVVPRPIIPRKGTPEYAALMEAMGVRPEVIAAGLLSFHFTNLQAWIKELDDRGAQLPTRVEYDREPRSTFRRRRSRDDSKLKVRTDHGEE